MSRGWSAMLMVAGLLWASPSPAQAESFRQRRSSSLSTEAFQSTRQRFSQEFGILRSGRSHIGVLEDASLGRWEFESHAQQMWETFPSSRFRQVR